MTRGEGFIVKRSSDTALYEIEVGISANNLVQIVLRDHDEAKLHSGIGVALDDDEIEQLITAIKYYNKKRKEDDVRSEL